MSTAATLASFNATILEMKARLAAVEAAELQGTQEINTFYLMWAGADLGLEWECQSPPINHASAPSCAMRRCAHLPHAGWFRNPQRWLHSRQERQQHPAQGAHAAPCPMLARDWRGPCEHAQNGRPCPSHSRVCARRRISSMPASAALRGSSSVSCKNCKTAAVAPIPSGPRGF